MRKKKAFEKNTFTIHWDSESWVCTGVKCRIKTKKDFKNFLETYAGRKGYEDDLIEAQYFGTYPPSKYYHFTVDYENKVIAIHDLTLSISGHRYA